MIHKCPISLFNALLLVPVLNLSNLFNGLIPLFYQVQYIASAQYLLLVMLIFMAKLCSLYVVKFNYSLLIFNMYNILCFLDYYYSLS